MRLNAYYYSFDHTGDDTIDLILSAVASAGKAFHHTDGWTEPCDPSNYQEGLRGADMVEGIQNAAFDAANRVLYMECRLQEMGGQLDRVISLVDDPDSPLPDEARAALCNAINSR